MRQTEPDTRSDGHSICSSTNQHGSYKTPQGKRGSNRFSLRRLFYASPLMTRGRVSRSLSGGSGRCGKTSNRDSDTHSEQSSSLHHSDKDHHSATSLQKDSHSSTSSQTGAASRDSHSAVNVQKDWYASVCPQTAGALPAMGATRLPQYMGSQQGTGAAKAAAAPRVAPQMFPADSTAGKSSGDQMMECPLCLTELNQEYFPELITCPHRSCYDCLQQYLKIEILESRINICCPECVEPIHPNDMKMILNNDALMEKYEEFMLRRVLAIDPDTRWCPAPDCGFAVIAAGCASCPKIKCERPGCESYFCYHCKADWHPNQTCDMARSQRSPNVRSSSVSFSQDSQHRDDIKPCPGCQVLIVKMDDGSCNHMTCAVCEAEFCWLCMKEISDLHYLSPSGCTFWGKKPWSRKKKILWQLGTLVGAPVGIGLVAGIAVPAMIIGIPVWVGRKLYARYQQANKHKRNLAITGGVTASILVSPILAGLAVGIGVPILLAYVYGVVPISLCRSGGCGVTTSASGVRIEFDDENDVGFGGRNTGDAVSVDTVGVGQRVPNPSIGEVSFGMSASLSMGSGSHLERMGRDSDRESASNTALAGSIASSVVASGHKLEVQADVSSNKRFSFSSETASATVSLSEKSATVSLADDGTASTKALAGSVLSYKIGDNVSVMSYRGPVSDAYTPVEVHIDTASQRSDDTHHPPSLSPVSSFSGDELLVGCRRSGRRRLAIERQVSENGSLLSGDDAISERVRFDDNVSFIDDQIYKDPPYQTPPECAELVRYCPQPVDIQAEMDELSKQYVVSDKSGVGEYVAAEAGVSMEKTDVDLENSCQSIAIATNFSSGADNEHVTRVDVGTCSSGDQSPVTVDTVTLQIVDHKQEQDSADETKLEIDDEFDYIEAAPLEIRIDDRKKCESLVLVLPGSAEQSTTTQKMVSEPVTRSVFFCSKEETKPTDISDKNVVLSKSRYSLNKSKGADEFEVLSVPKQFHIKRDGLGYVASSPLPAVEEPDNQPGREQPARMHFECEENKNIVLNRNLNDRQEPDNRNLEQTSESQFAYVFGAAGDNIMS